MLPFGGDCCHGEKATAAGNGASQAHFNRSSPTRGVVGQYDRQGDPEFDSFEAILGK